MPFSPWTIDGVRMLTTTAWRQGGLHRIAAVVYYAALAWLAQNYYGYCDSEPVYKIVMAVLACVVLVLTPPLAVAWREANRKDVDKAFIKQSSSLHEEWPISKIIARAKRVNLDHVLSPDAIRRVKPVNPKRTVPDILVICKGGTSWRGGAFVLNKEPETARALRNRKTLSIGILFCQASSDAERSMVALKPEPVSTLETEAEQTISEIRTFWKKYPDLADRVEARTYGAGLVDSLSAFDPGYPDNPVVYLDINRGYAEQPYPILRVECVGEQRELYEALLTRALSIWNLGTPVMLIKPCLDVIE